MTFNCPAFFISIEKISLLKTYIRRLHLVLALISALFLINVSVSGALLVFAKEIQEIVNPHFWEIERNNQSENRKTLPLSVLKNIIEMKTGEKIQFIQMGNTQSSMWQIKLLNKNYVSINPFTGDIVLIYDFDNTFYGFVMSWHRWLLYLGEDSKRPFQLWISVASLILIIEVIIGVFLWARPKNRLKRLRVRWKSKSKVLLYQLHGTLGLFLSIPLILIAFSGISFFWKDATQTIVEVLTFSQVEKHDFKKEVAVPKHLNYQLDKAYFSAVEPLKSGTVYRVYLPNSAGQPLALRIKMPNESHAYSWSWSDPYTGKFLYCYDASKASIASKVWHFRYSFHIGDFIGWPIKFLWVVIALLPVFFFFSGIYIWSKRAKK